MYIPKTFVLTPRRKHIGKVDDPILRSREEHSTKPNERKKIIVVKATRQLQWRRYYKQVHVHCKRS